MNEKRFILEDEVIIDNDSVADDGGRELYWTFEYIQRQRLVELMNSLNDENEQLKQELQRIYDVATLKKTRDIVDKIYDDLLYETSEKSDYARNKVLECLEKLDEFGDGLE